MQSEWKVTSNYLCDTKVYAVYRLKDASKTDHSGNREFATGYIEDKQRASDIAEEMNQGGGSTP